MFFSTRPTAFVDRGRIYHTYTRLPLIPNGEQLLLFSRVLSTIIRVSGGRSKQL